MSLTGKVGVEFTNQLTTDNGTRYAEAARLLCIGGVLNPLWANRVCGVLGIKMTGYALKPWIPVFPRPTGLAYSLSPPSTF